MRLNIYWRFRRIQRDSVCGDNMAEFLNFETLILHRLTVGAHPDVTVYHNEKINIQSYIGSPKS